MRSRAMPRIALENANLYRSVETKALELERLKIYTENIIESINIAVLALDLSGVITSCNRAFEELYGIDRSQIQGANVANLLARDVITSIQEAAGTAGWESEDDRQYFQALPAKPQKREADRQSEHHPADRFDGSEFRMPDRDGQHHGKGPA